MKGKIWLKDRLEEYKNSEEFEELLEKVIKAVMRKNDAVKRNN